LLFGVEARQKADALEEQAVQLREQTRAAKENARRAEENEKEVKRVLVSGLLIPVGRSQARLATHLDDGEADAMRQLRMAPAPVRLQFLEMALRDPETARRVGHRAEWVIQAMVGCDRDLRADVARLVGRRIQEPGAPQEVMVACARFGLPVNLTDRAWAERSADALVVALGDPLIDRDDYPPLAAALAAVSERLPPAQAADHAARALDVLVTRLREPKGKALAMGQLVLAITAISPGLDAAAATRGAEALGTTIRQNHPVYWPGLSMALAAVCRQLPTSDAAAHVNAIVDLIIKTREGTAEMDKALYTAHARALGALCERLDAARASRTAGAIIAILGDGPTVAGHKSEFITFRDIAAVLTKVAERVDAHGSLRAAEDLVVVLQRSSGNIVVDIDELRAALVAVCSRVDAAGAARVAEAMSTAARDPKTPLLVRTLYADAQVALAGRLTAGQAATLERAVVDSLREGLVDAKWPQFRGFLGQALATACGRAGATDVARAAEALDTAIRDPQTPVTLLRPLAAALATVNGRLPSKERSSHAKQSVDALDALWVAKTTSQDRAAVAEALAAVWTCLGPVAAAARARRMAGDLENALRDSKAAPDDVAGFAIALSAVYTHLDPADRRMRADAVADMVVAALRKPKNGPFTIAKLSESLAATCAHQERPGAVRVANALLAILDDPNDSQFRFSLPGKLFKKVAARLDERDFQRLLGHPLAAGPLQRYLLDVRAGSSNRVYRNTWDYLDRTAANANRMDGL
jgi:hypothetical protein